MPPNQLTNQTPQLPSQPSPLRMIIVVVVFMFVIIGAIVLFFVLSSSGGDTVTPIVTEEKEPSKVDRDAIEGTQLEEVPVNKSASGTYGLTFTVRNKIRPFIAGGEYGLIQPADTDDEYLAIDVEAINDGDLNLSLIAPNDFKLLDAQDVEYPLSYDIDENEMWAIGFKPFTITDFEPGDDADGYMIFQVPKDSTGLRLVYDLEEQFIFGSDEKVSEVYEISL